MTTTWTITETAERLALMDGLPLDIAEQTITTVAAEVLPTWSETADWTPGQDIPAHAAAQLIDIAHWRIVDHPVLINVTDEDDQIYAGTRNVHSWTAQPEGHLTETGEWAQFDGEPIPEEW